MASWANISADRSFELFIYEEPSFLLDAPPDPEPNSSRRRAPSYILLVDKEQLEYSKLLQLIDSISKCSDWSHEQLRNLESRIIRAREEYDGTANDLWAYQKTAGAEAEARDSDRKHQSVTNAVESAIDKIHKFSAYVNSTPKLSPIREVYHPRGFLYTLTLAKRSTPLVMTFF